MWGLRKLKKLFILFLVLGKTSATAVEIFIGGIFRPGVRNVAIRQLLGISHKI